MKCVKCDHELATDGFLVDHDETCEHCKSLCWSHYNGQCSHPEVDWRGRALEAEEKLATLASAFRGLIGVSP